MKTLLSIVVITLMASRAFAEDALMDGGRSPDGKYEVRIARDTNPDDAPLDYNIRLHSTATAKPFYTLDNVGGYLGYEVALERNKALWHSSGEVVAITDQGTRHSQELYLLAVRPDRAERLELPDYVQNALGRIDATSVDFACVSSPKRWEGDDLIVDFHFTANHRRSYTCEVVLHVYYHGENSMPSVELKSVSIPKEKNG